MSPSTLHPKWWQLYLTVPLLIILFILDSRLKISTGEHEFLQLGIVLLVYGLVHLWLKANRSALVRENRAQTPKTYRVIEIPPDGSPELEKGSKPILQIPDSEIHGLLGDGLEMSYTDPEKFSYKEIHKN